MRTIILKEEIWDIKIIIIVYKSITLLIMLQLLIEYATFFGTVVEEYDVKDLPNKDIIDFCKIFNWVI